MIIQGNINDVIEVQLTAYGRKRLCDQGAPASHTDAEGWTRFHVHELMQYFGQDLRQGTRTLPFQPTFRLHIKDRERQPTLPDLVEA